MKPTVPPTVQKVRTAIAEHGLKREIIELTVHARTSQQAADALGVTVGQIVKSLVFTADDRPLLVAASGVNRVDERRLGELAGGRIRRADPDTVKRTTGYTIGGVPPIGLDGELAVYIDRDLLGYDLVYAAAGRPECVFPIAPDELVRATNGRVVDIKQVGSDPAGGRHETRGQGGADHGSGLGHRAGDGGALRA